MQAAWRFSLPSVMAAQTGLFPQSLDGFSGFYMINSTTQMYLACFLHNIFNKSPSYSQRLQRDYGPTISQTGSLPGTDRMEATKHTTFLSHNPFIVSTLSFS